MLNQQLEFGSETNWKTMVLYQKSVHFLLAGSVLCVINQWHFAVLEMSVLS